MVNVPAGRSVAVRAWHDSVIRRVAAANGFGRHAERLTSAHRSSARAHRARRGRRRSEVLVKVERPQRSEDV
jgi:hypothetical protein